MEKPKRPTTPENGLPRNISESLVNENGVQDLWSRHRPNEEAKAAAKGMSVEMYKLLYPQG